VRGEGIGDIRCQSSEFVELILAHAEEQAIGATSHRGETNGGSQQAKFSKEARPSQFVEYDHFRLTRPTVLDDLAHFDHAVHHDEEGGAWFAFGDHDRSFRSCFETKHRSEQSELAPGSVFLDAFEEGNLAQGRRSTHAAHTVEGQLNVIRYQGDEGVEIGPVELQHHQVRQCHHRRRPTRVRGGHGQFAEEITGTELGQNDAA
jgi:hypothetical protein